MQGRKLYATLAFLFIIMFVDLMVLGGCSPMPGHFGLINGVERVHSLDEMEVVYHTGTFLETAAACNKMTWDDGFQAKLITILSAGCSMGCTVVSGPEVGVIRRCDIWYTDWSSWWPGKWITEHNLDHERKHCQGYADLF